MNEPIDSYRLLAQTPAEAVRWACLLEATAPKAGNVYPGRSFEKLTYADFVAAAEIAAAQFGSSERCISERMKATVDKSVSATGTNVNLGIVLLLGPLVAADEALSRDKLPRTATRWSRTIGEVLRAFDVTDGQNIYCAINRASAGGLGTVEAMDVHETSGPVDIGDAMRLAADHDRIARQYASEFSDLIENVAPVVRASICDSSDVLVGISRAHLRLLMSDVDTLIARKNGVEVALAVQERARAVDFDDPSSIAKFDQSLRGDANRLNPGTTADLIAAAVYYLLRSTSEDQK